MSGKTKGWSERRKKQQACNARKQKPWTRSTGPRTAEGKAAASQNAFKHGFESADIRELKRVLRLQRAFLKDCKN